MVFSSAVFLFLFLPIVFIGYYLLKDKYKNLFLLVASLLFYAWGEPKFVFVMILSIIINYFSGIIIYKYQKEKRKKIVQVLFGNAIFLNLALLIYFKYFNFFIENFNVLFKRDIFISKIALPVGISFFTFQAMSYIIDLYKKEIKVQKKFSNLALYISLFPQLIAGPIVRYKSIERQLNKRHHNIYSISIGLRRFISGLTKKVFFANILGEVADKIFVLNVNEYSQGVAWLGIVCYFFQIYFDFSGYSDMAIGLGRMFGFRFIENFNYPYISKTITEFWRRWHISLSTWFRDYVYFPLGGNRKSRLRTYVNLIIVFIITGFWHGAAWNFLLWGLFHGVFLIIEKTFMNVNKKRMFGIWNIYTIFVVINSWVLFRVPDLKYGIEFYKKMYFFHDKQSFIYDLNYFLDQKISFFLIGALLFSTPLMKFLLRNIRKVSLFKIGFIFERFVYIVLIYLNIIFVGAATYNPFIYFRF